MQQRSSCVTQQRRRCSSILGHMFDISRLLVIFVLLVCFPPVQAVAGNSLDGRDFTSNNSSAANGVIPAKCDHGEGEYPFLVRKMSDDPGQKFFGHYWSLDSIVSSGEDAERPRDKISLNARSPLLLHSYPLPVAGRSVLGKRGFECPAGSAPCGGCCTPGYTCVAEGCLLVTTTTVIITLPSSTITTVSTISHTTIAPPPPPPSTTETAPTVLPPGRPTSNPSTSTASIPDLCPIGFYACSAVYGGGCCQTGRNCETTSCPVTASLTTVESNGVTVVIPVNTTPNSASATATRRCADGWMSCPPNDGGGCCPNGYQCGEVSCTASATNIGTAVIGKAQPGNSGSRFSPTIYTWMISLIICVLLL
ncbi:GPI anchored protein, putative [Trichophyton benhamiae CBS 112371]|uniref:GPI anchored protein, putative n=1 Tax=Arthroderma benhamiae (strain ATCC MYA-4681 / CBS 112371) TaxID=663331 RepID=D4AUY3_ARTBC|nr:GPI anchored protein, putative [Trichophyton benhamiae CBS 112371]EFE33298.1 GPI anchored protein, putative [Trichophyton benhamiae CBS 112371]